MKFPLRSMTVGEILDTAIRLLIHRFLLLNAIGLAVALPSTLLSSWIENAEAAPNSTAAAILPLIALMLTSLVAQPITTAATTKAVADTYLGKRAGFGSSFAYAAGLFLPLLGAMILAGLGIMVGFLLLVIPGLLLMLRFSFVSQVVVVERRGGSGALSRSGQLMKGNYGRIFGIYILLYLIFFGLGMLLGMVGPINDVAILVIEILTATITGAFSAAVLTIAYFESRCRREGFDLQVLAESMGQVLPAQGEEGEQLG